MLYRQAGMMMRQSVFHCTFQILETDVVEEVWVEIMLSSWPKLNKANLLTNAMELILDRTVP
jgi:hypothetical protein